MVHSQIILINAYTDGDGYTAECWSLPGVVSTGESEAEAVRDCWTALALTILTYEQEGKAIPWVAEAHTGEPSDG